MRFMKLLPSIAVLSLGAAGLASASPAAGGGPDPAPAGSPVAKAALDANEPIVSGRSVSAHHKSKMHHVRANPDHLGDAPLADEIAPAGE